MSKAHRHDEIEETDKYERLEELLLQTLRLAGEIAESKGRPSEGECIILRKRSNSDPAEAKRPDIRRSLLKRRHNLSMDDSENSQSQSQSPASSVQEPFSPVALAVSLDSIVEQGRRSQNDLCILDNASTTSNAPCLAEPPSNRSSVLSIDDAQHGLAAPSPSPQLHANEHSPKKLQRPCLPQKSTSMIVHSGQESLVESSTENFMAQQVTENPKNERLGRRRTPVEGLPQGSPAASRSPRSQRTSGTAPKRPQKIKEEHSGGEAMVATDHPSPPKWHVESLPVASARDSSKLNLSSPALMKFEAVFPLKGFAQSNAASSLAYNSESSYIIIGPVPMVKSAESPLSRDQEEDNPIPYEKSLQDFIDEWEYDAEASGSEEKRL